MRHALYRRVEAAGDVVDEGSLLGELALQARPHGAVEHLGSDGQAASLHLG